MIIFNLKCDLYYLSWCLCISFLEICLFKHGYCRNDFKKTDWFKYEYSVVVYDNYDVG